jgi:hypothetical protein
MGVRLRWRRGSEIEFGGMKLGLGASNLPLPADVDLTGGVGNPSSSWCTGVIAHRPTNRASQRASQVMALVRYESVERGVRLAKRGGTRLGEG